MTFNPLNAGLLGSAPVGDIIASVGEGVAQAQAALDAGSMSAMFDIYSQNDDALLTLFREAGYRPTFYALPETTGEIKVDIKMSQSGTGSAKGVARPVRLSRQMRPATAQSVASRTQPQALSTAMSLHRQRARPKLYGAPIDAAYGNSYSTSSQTSATITFRIVPIPAPEGLDDIRVMPTLIGLSEAAAQTQLNSLNLAMETDSPPAANTVVQTQSVAEDVIVRAGDVVTLTFG